MPDFKKTATLMMFALIAVAIAVRIPQLSAIVFDTPTPRLGFGPSDVTP